MVTKGIITEIINKYQARVRIPIYNKAEESPTATPNEELSIGPVSTLPGISPNISVGDVVIIAFEQDIYTDPVILGLLYTENSSRGFSDVRAGELSVISEATLPFKTTIGNVTGDQISSLKDIKGNVQNQLDLLSDKFTEITESSVYDVKVAGTSVVIEGVADIPYASASQAGVVSTGAQTFAGEKTFNSPVIATNNIQIKTSSAYAQYGFRNAGSSATTGFMEEEVSATGNRIYFTQYGRTDGTTDAYRESFFLPQTNSRTSNASYNILTSKSAVTVAQGGTGASTFTSGALLTGNGTGAVNAYTPAWQSWTAGAAAGPKAKIKLGNVDYESAAIPSASASASGIVTTGEQTIAGAKTFNSSIQVGSSTATGGGVQTRDKNSFSFPIGHYNGTNLWLGKTETAAQSFAGKTFINTGYDETNSVGNATVYVSVPNAANNSGTSYGVYHTGYKPSPADIGALALSGGTMTGQLNNTFGSSGAPRHYENVAFYENNGSSYTGTIKIKLPNTTSNNVMMVMRVIVYDYNANSGCELIISGYTYNDGKWYNYNVSPVGTFTKGVRFAYDGTNYCILLGTTSSTWNYSKVILADVYSGYGTQPNTGYAISLITSESGYTVTATASTQLTATNFNGTVSNVNLTNTTGSGTSYYIPFATGYSGSQALRANDHFYIYDTASETWINSGKSGRKGGVTLWNGSYYNNLTPNGSLTANRTITFPNATGTVSLEGHSHAASDITSGTLAVARGGTGATTAADARTNLGIGASGTHADSYFALASHTHSYAGSSSAGGSATSAVKLDTSAGSAINPVYFSGGKPVACTTLTSLATGKGYGFADFTLSGAAASYKYLIMFGYVVSGAARVSTIIPMDQISTTELQFQIADYNNSYRSVGIKKSGNDIIFSSTNGYAKSGSSFDVYGGI